MCKLEKDDSSFSKKRKGLQSFCKPCNREYQKKFYRDNIVSEKERSIVYKKNNVAKIRTIILESLKDGCIDCGEKDIVVLDFDHIDRKTKIKSIAQMMRDNLNTETIKLEIAKCEVRCANCHRRKTARENNSWRLYEVVAK